MRHCGLQVIDAARAVQVMNDRLPRNVDGGQARAYRRSRVIIIIIIIGIIVVMIRRRWRMNVDIAAVGGGIGTAASKAAHNPAQHACRGCCCCYTSTTTAAAARPTRCCRFTRQRGRRWRSSGHHSRHGHLAYAFLAWTPHVDVLHFASTQMLVFFFIIIIKK